MVASPIQAGGDGNSIQGSITITVTTSCVTNTHRNSISVYLDYPPSTLLHSESGKPNSSNQRLFSQPLSVNTRHASRSDEVHVPLSAISGFRSACPDGFLKLRVQVL